MRPSVVALGFVLGSAAAITFSLVGVSVVFALLRSEHPRLGDELPALLLSLGMFSLLTAAAAASFYGQVHRRAWRHAATAILLLGLAFVGWYHWPS